MIFSSLGISAGAATRALLPAIVISGLCYAGLAVTAGLRARVINPLSYGYRPYLYQNQLGQFANEFKIKYSY